MVDASFYVVNKSSSIDGHWQFIIALLIDRLPTLVIMYPDNHTHFTVDAVSGSATGCLDGSSLHGLQMKTSIYWIIYSFKTAAGCLLPAPFFPLGLYSIVMFSSCFLALFQSLHPDFCHLRPNFQARTVLGICCAFSPHFVFWHAAFLGSQGEVSDQGSVICLHVTTSSMSAIVYGC